MGWLTPKASMPCEPVDADRRRQRAWRCVACRARRDKTGPNERLAAIASAFNVGRRPVGGSAPERSAKRPAARRSSAGRRLELRLVLLWVVDDLFGSGTGDLGGHDPGALEAPPLFAGPEPFTELSMRDPRSSVAWASVLTPTVRTPDPPSYWACRSGTRISSPLISARRSRIDCSSRFSFRTSCVPNSLGNELARCCARSNCRSSSCSRRCSRTCSTARPLKSSELFSTDHQWEILGRPRVVLPTAA